MRHIFHSLLGRLGVGKKNGLCRGNYVQPPAGTKATITILTSPDTEIGYKLSKKGFRVGKYWNANKSGHVRELFIVADLLHKFEFDIKIDLEFRSPHEMSYHSWRTRVITSDNKYYTIFACDVQKNTFFADVPCQILSKLTTEFLNEIKEYNTNNLLDNDQHYVYDNTNRNYRSKVDYNHKMKRESPITILSEVKDDNYSYDDDELPAGVLPAMSKEYLPFWLQQENFNSTKECLSMNTHSPASHNIDRAITPSQHSDFENIISPSVAVTPSTMSKISQNLIIENNNYINEISNKEESETLPPPLISCEPVVIIEPRSQYKYRTSRYSRRYRNDKFSKGIEYGSKGIEYDNVSTFH